MMKTKKYLSWLFITVVLTSCLYDFPETERATKLDLGEISVEKLIAIGDGYLAGAMDGALYSEGQKNSVAAIITAQINKIEETPFVQPGINAENGYNFYASSQTEFFGKWVYKFRNQTDEKPLRYLTQVNPVQNYTGDKSNLNNLAIPLLSVNQLLETLMGNNPFFARVFENKNSTVVEQVVQKSPSFVICWIGMNDFLKYAMNGATKEADLTTAGNFTLNFTLFIDEIIQKTNSKIVIGNLVSIKDLPYFYTNQYNFIRLTNTKKNAAQAKYSKYNDAVMKHNVGITANQKRAFISFEDNGATLYPQPVVVIDESLPDAFYPDRTPLEKYRQLTEGEIVLFSVTAEMVENGMGTLYPLSQEFYLTSNQINLIEERFNVYEAIINNITQKYSARIAVADLKNVVHEIAETGKTDAWGTPVSDKIFYVDGVPLSGRLDLNSIFSLDAIHFNQRGNALVANVFIEAINTKFKANIPVADVNNYIGNSYPAPY